MDDIISRSSVLKRVGDQVIFRPHGEMGPKWVVPEEKIASIRKFGKKSRNYVMLLAILSSVWLVVATPYLFETPTWVFMSALCLPSILGYIAFLRWYQGQIRVHTRHLQKLEFRGWAREFVASIEDHPMAQNVLGVMGFLLFSVVLFFFATKFIQMGLSGFEAGVNWFFIMGSLVTGLVSLLMFFMTYHAWRNVLRKKKTQ